MDLVIPLWLWLFSLKRSPAFPRGAYRLRPGAIRAGELMHEKIARSGPYVTTRGRIMSCSSCSRMWQCHTYSLPPVLGLGWCRYYRMSRLLLQNRRHLELHDNPGYLTGVHPYRFLPPEFGWIGRPRWSRGTYQVRPVNVAGLKGSRFRIWTFTRWKWIGCVSPVRLKISQISTSPFAGFSVTGVKVCPAELARGLR